MWATGYAYVMQTLAFVMNVLFVWGHYKCGSVDPGYLTPPDRDLFELRKPEASACKKCYANRTEEMAAHHCSKCGRCVE